MTVLYPAGAAERSGTASTGGQGRWVRARTRAGQRRALHYDLRPAGLQGFRREAGPKPPEVCDLVPSEALTFLPFPNLFTPLPCTESDASVLSLPQV